MSRNRKRTPADRSGNRALKIVLFGGSITLVLLFAGLFAIKAGIERYRNSDAFRERIEQKVAAILKSETALDALRWDGATAFAGSFRAKGYEDAGLAGLEMDGLRATLGGVEKGAWQIGDATISRLNIDFSRDRLPGTYASTLGGADAAGSSGPEAPAWLKRFLPDRFEIDAIETDAATLRVLDAKSTETFALRSVKTDFVPQADSGWEISGRGGKLFVATRPEMGIDHFRVRWQGQNLFVNEAAIELEGKARASFSGSVALNDGTDLDLDLDLANFDLQQWIAAGPWRDRTSGTVRGTMKVTGPARDAAALRQKGTLHLDDGLVKDLPILKSIAKYTKNDRFERLTLNEATADFERQGDRVEITKLVVQSDGLSRLEGTLSLTGRNVSGQFKFGVTPGTLRWLPGAERKVFVEAHEGFLWTDLKLTGTLDEPREDLTARLVVAAAESLVEESPEKAIEAAKEALKNPTATPGAVIEEGKKLLDALGPLFK
jgi:hypothetical protein